MKTVLSHFFIILSAWASLASCAKDAGPREDGGGTYLTLEFHSDDCYSMDLKSSIISDESLIYDLNIWIYNEDGKKIDTHFESGNPLFAGNGRLSLRMLVKGGGSVLVIANAGRELEAPRFITSDISIVREYESGNVSAQGVLAMGTSGFEKYGDGYRCSVPLKRIMSRIELDVKLCSDVLVEGGELGSSIRVLSARLCNSGKRLYFQPSYAIGSAIRSKAVSADDVCNYEYLSESDLDILNSGGRVCMYSLPNYTDVAYSPVPASRTAFSTYVEMRFGYDSYGLTSEGETVCRFYANDGGIVGLQGGVSYGVTVNLSENGATAIWRKDDGRVLVPSDFVVGETKEIFLVQPKPAAESGAYAWSLAPDSEVLSDGFFEVVSNIYGSYGELLGVKVKSDAEGESVLYLRDTRGYPIGNTRLKAEFPDISAGTVRVDVTGDISPVVLYGLPDMSLFANPSDYEEFYSVDNISAGIQFGINASNFLDFSCTEPCAWVCETEWTQDGHDYTWKDVAGKSFPVELTFSSGRSTAFSITVADDLVGPLASNLNFGESFDMSLVDSPKSAVRALGERRTIAATYTGSIPSTLYSAAWTSERWSSFLDKDCTVSADSYFSSRTASSLRWDFPASFTSANMGENHIYIARRNPWCNRYVSVKLGYFHCTGYIPTGVDVFIGVVSFDQWGRCVYGYSAQYLVSCLIFRAHDEYAALHVSPDTDFYHSYKVDGYFTGIGNQGYKVFRNNGITYLETNFDGNLLDNDNFEEHFMNSAQNTANTLWNGALCRNMLYLYSPYEASSEVKRVNAAGLPADGSHGALHVHKWEVSEKSYFTFNYAPWGNRVNNDEYRAEWY